MNIFANKRAFYAAVLFLGLLAMTARQATDPDLWWHLRTGQWIAETGHIPRTDPFSFTRGGSPWVSHEWLSEIIFYQIWKHGGPGALIVFSSLITAAGLLLLYWRCPGQPHWAAAATVLGAMASAPSWGARPQMFTYAMASLLLWLVERAEGQRPGHSHLWSDGVIRHAEVEERPLLLLWIPPLFLVWLNLHAGFALGPALLFLYAAGLTMEVAIGSTPWREARPTILQVLAVILVCLALVPFNPSGAKLYRYPLDTLRSPGMRALIVEWFSPDFHRALYTPFLLVLLLLLAALAYSRSQVKGRVLLPLVSLCCAALDAVRHIPIFILLTMPVITAALPEAPSFERLPVVAPVRPRLRQLFRSAVLILLAAFVLSRWVSLGRSQSGREAQQFPESAVAFLKASNQPARIFVYYDWAGYAIWKLYPQYRVFVDGRADLFDGTLLHQGIRTVPQLQNGWRTVLDDWHVGTVLLPTNTALAHALALDPQWSCRYRDSLAVLFTRTAPQPGAPGTSTMSLPNTGF